MRRDGRVTAALGEEVLFAARNLPLVALVVKWIERRLGGRGFGTKKRARFDEEGTGHAIAARMQTVMQERVKPYESLLPSYQRKSPALQAYAEAERRLHLAILKRATLHTGPPVQAATAGIRRVY